MPRYEEPFQPTLVHALRHHARDARRGFTVVRGDGSEREIPFAQLAALAEARAAQLQARGVKKGDRVGIVIPDSDEFIVTFLAAMVAGAAPVPIYPPFSFKNLDGYLDSVAHILRAAGATLFVTTGALHASLAPALELRAVPAECVSLEALAERSQPFRSVDVGPDDLAFLQFTSGSTSRPKGVVVRHAHLAANAKAFMVDGVDVDPRFDRTVSWLPLFHDMGLIGFVVGPLFTGTPGVFLMTSAFVRAPRLWLETVTRTNGTITYAPNFAYALINKRVKAKDLDGLDLGTLRVAGCGAEPISAKVLRDFASLLAPVGFRSSAFLPSYGMAEATLAVTFVDRARGLVSEHVAGSRLEFGHAEPCPPEAHDARELVNCGRAFPGHDVRIVSPEGGVLGDRQVGEIVTRGPSVCDAYYENPEASAEAFRGGWLHTGDLGYLSGGDLYVCGRAKDLVIVRGRNFYPSDIEWAVGELERVKRGNVCVFSVPGDDEEKVVVVAEGSRSDAEALGAAVKTCVLERFGLNVHAVPVIPPGTLPKTSSGKLQRRKTRELYLADKLPQHRGAVGAGGAAPDEGSS
jgi:fatty-acyl-CoA synthase